LWRKDPAKQPNLLAVVGVIRFRSIRDPLSSEPDQYEEADAGKKRKH
jgi:hypothetical protein